MQENTTSRIVCHECDLLVGVPVLVPGQKAFCPRCGYLLTANRPHAFHMILACAVTGLIFLALGTAFPFLGFSAGGQNRTVTLLQSIGILAAEKMPEMAVIVFASIILIPAIFLLGIIYVLAGIIRRKALPEMTRILRWSLKLVPWSMAEIFLIGILVSFVKIVTIADVSLGLSFWSYTLFTMSVAAIVVFIDKRELWSRVKALQDA